MGTVTVDGPPIGDGDTQRFFESITAFEEATSLQVNYIGDKEFEARLQARTDSAFDPAGPGLLGVIVFEADGIASPSSGQGPN